MKVLDKLRKPRGMKKPAALALALCCVALAACQAPAGQDAAQPGASGAPNAPTGMVYAEETLDVSAYGEIPLIRPLADGTVAGIGYTLNENGERDKACVFKVGDDGKLTQTAELNFDEDNASANANTDAPPAGDSSAKPADKTASSSPPAGDAGAPKYEAIRSYAMDNKGEIYVHETLDYMTLRGDSNAAAPAPEPPPPQEREKPKLRRLSPDGKELSSVTLQAPAAASQSYSTWYDVQVDAEAGLLYEYSQMHGTLNVYDIATGELKKTIKHEDGYLQFSAMESGNICQLSYGENGVSLRAHNPVTGEEKWNITTQDYPEDISYNPLDKKVYTRMGRKLSAIAEDGTTETLAELTDFSVMSPFGWLSTITVGKDGAIYCLIMEQSNRERLLATREQALTQMEEHLDKNPNATVAELSSLIMKEAREAYKMKLVRIAKTDAANVPPVKEVTVSVLNEDNRLSQMASAFHAANPGYRVKFKEMIPEAEMKQLQSDNVDYSELIKRANTEIITGKAADVLTLSSFPFESYGRKNILEDLIPYMEADPDFNTADYRENILNAFKQDGKLFAVPTNFNVPALASKKGTFTKDALTSDEFFSALSSLAPEETPSVSAEDLFSNILANSLEQLKGADGVKLDTPEFIGFLENIKKADEQLKRLPPRDENGGGMTYFGTSASSLSMPVIDDPQIYGLGVEDISDFSAASLFKQRYGKDFEVRFPPSIVPTTTKGFMSGYIYGINRASENKDAAWAFIKFLLSYEIQTSELSSYALPVNQKASVDLVNLYVRESALAPRENAIQRRVMGDTRDEATDSYMQKFLDNRFLQEDADKLEALLGKVDTLLNYDDTVQSMAAEELGPFLKGQKSAQDTAKTLESRLAMYMSEQQ